MIMMEVSSEMAKIKCQVDSCVYHGKNEVCKADSIMVKNNPQQDLGMEIGAFAGENQAATSAQTMCETYKPHSEGE